MTFIELIQLILSVLFPIGLYILAGYYASNGKWCSRKIFVSVVVGLALGGYAILQGITVTGDWIGIAFNSAPALGLIYLADRIVKGIAKRTGIDWLYSDEPIEEGV